MAGRRRLKKVGIGCLVVIAIGVGFVYLTPAGKAIRDLWGNGTISALVSETKPRDYSAVNSEQNLKALYVAMMLHHDSEGQFPEAAKWMDTIEKRLPAADLPKEEAVKKLIRPDLLKNPGQFGYAMNDAAAGKYKGDLKDSKTVLIFESKSTTRNAHGDPKKDGVKGEILAISINGEIIRLK